MCLDRQGRLVSLNTAGQSLLGLEVSSATPVLEQVGGLKLRRADGRPIERQDTLLARVLRGGSAGSEEIVLTRPDGTEIRLVTRVAPVRDEEGALTGVTAIFRGVTAPATLEAERSRAAGYLRLLLDSTDQGIYGIDREGRCTFMNRAAMGMLGYEFKEVVGRNGHALIHHSRPDGSPYPVAECPIVAAIRAGTSCRLDNEVLWRKDGTPFLVEYSSFPLLEEGVVAGAVVTFIDITERKRAEDLRRQLAVEQAARTGAEKNEAMLRAVFASMTEVVLIIDSTGRYLRAPPTNVSLLYRPPEEFVGKTIHEVFPRDEADFFLGVIRRCLTERKTQELEYTLRIADRDVNFLAHFSPLSEEAVVLVAHDITDRKRAEEERARLLASEHEARSAAEEANRVKDLFLATVSHELRTPLSTILLRVEQLLRGGSGESSTRRALEAIRKSAKDQARLVEDLLDVARISSNKLELRKEPIDLAPLVSSSVADFRAEAAAREVQLDASIDPDTGVVEGDRLRLEQVVSNLLTNALKFTPSGGRVTVALERREDRAILRVSDTGSGIDPADLPKVFTRFYQAERRMVRARGGMGLGLALVRDLVQLHGGTAEAQSAGRGQGATFTVTLPLRPR